MTSRPTFSEELLLELPALVEQCLDGSASEDQVARLNHLLVTDPQASILYARYVVTSCGLKTWSEYPLAEAKGDGLLSAEGFSPDCADEDQSRFAPAAPRGFVGGLYNGAASFFSEQPVLFSYVVATVCLAAAVALSSMFYISRTYDADLAWHERKDASPPVDRIKYVARITGMKDCRWSDENSEFYIGTGAPIGREYSLDSGLLEITYKSGARVILEGPCTYKIDSDAGGVLSVGKLTARVEIKGAGFRGQGSEIRGQRSEVRGQKSPNPQSPIPNPFFVRTPTALVTDLGTEFGVEVAKNGDTVSHVFQGSIKVQGLSASTDSSIVLRANESIRVSRVRETHQGQSLNETVRFTHPTETPDFVRRMPEPPPVVYLKDSFDNRKDSSFHGSQGGLGLNKDLELRQSGLYPRTIYYRGGIARNPSAAQVCNSSVFGKLSFHLRSEETGWLVLNHNFPRNVEVSTSVAPNAAFRYSSDDFHTPGNTNNEHWLALGMLGRGVALADDDLTRSPDAGIVFQIRSNGRWTYYENGRPVSEGKVTAESIYNVAVSVLDDRVTVLVNDAAVDLDPTAGSVARTLSGFLKTCKDNYVSLAAGRDGKTDSDAMFVIGTVDDLQISSSRQTTLSHSGKEDAAEK